MLWLIRKSNVARNWIVVVNAAKNGLNNVNVRPKVRPKLKFFQLAQENSLPRSGRRLVTMPVSYFYAYLRISMSQMWTHV